jgi:hypothetical protein
MMSKPLKPGNKYEEKDEPTWKLKLRLWWYDFPPVKFVHDVEVFFRRLKRAIKWAQFMWTNWDFDAMTIWPLLERKLQRVQICLENGHAIQEPQHMKALKVALKLLNRLSNNYHETKLYDRHEKKWGEHITWFTPAENNCSRWNSTRANIKNAADKEAELADLRVLWDKEPKWRERDEKRCLAIIQKYHRYWWD